MGATVAAVCWLLLAVSVVAGATVGLCLGHLDGGQWLAVVGMSGVLGGAGVHLSAAKTSP